MFTFGTHFNDLFSNIKPPKERLDAARDLPPKVRQYLEDHQEFTTVHPHTKLAGSYGQDTSVGNVKDVDFLVRVPGNPDENEPNAKKLIQELKCALDELPKALGYLGFVVIDNIQIQRARRSVHIYLKGKDFHIDVVPCIAPEGFDKVLYVPDRGFNKWITSHPIGYISLLTELNDQHHGKVRPLIKLFKHFRNVHMINRKPKSYWLGALVMHHIRKANGLDTSKPLAELFHDLCDAVYLQYDHLLHVDDSITPNIPDPLLGHNISWNWSRSHFETFMRRLDDGRTWADKALKATNREVALDYWQQIFGEDYFKREVEESAFKMAASAFPGQSFITSNGVIQPERPASGLYTPIPKTTFHGKT
jgi:hypothetical protein